MSCTKEQIQKSCQDGNRHTEKVLTPEWGEPGVVHVRGLMASENGIVTDLAAPDSADDATKRRLGMISWCIACVCDKEGVRIFDNDDVVWLASDTSPLAPIYRCAMKAMEVNGLDEGTVGNLKTTQKGSSP